MPIINLTVSVSEMQAQQIETLRGDMPREEFLRMALELGIVDFQEESIKASKDFIYQAMLGRTESYISARKSRTIAMPKEDITKRAHHT